MLSFHSTRDSSNSPSLMHSSSSFLNASIPRSTKRIINPNSMIGAVRKQKSEHSRSALAEFVSECVDCTENVRIDPRVAIKNDDSLDTLQIK